MGKESIFKSEIVLKIFFLEVSMALYILSLFQTAFYVKYSPPEFPAFACLLWGALYLGETLAWLGNITLILSAVCLFIQNQIIGAVSSFITLLLMLSFLLEDKALVNEGGLMAPITGYGWGYWLWIASAAVLSQQTVSF